jgi:predicted O-methyltransferase YrrM
MAIKSIIKNILQKSRERNALKQAALMAASDDAHSRRVAQAITEALRHQLSPQELHWVNRIEALRAQLRKDPAQIRIMDFGAGGPQSKRSDAEMYEGVAETTTVAAMSHSSKPALEALVLFKLIRAYQSQMGIELGTCLGISAAYQAAAQQVNGSGKFISLEGAEALAELSRKHISSLNLRHVDIVAGRFQDNLQQVLESNKPIDYVFIDGHHDEQATVRYFEAILPFLADCALVIFDDIHWSAGMSAAWQTIIAREQVKLSVDFTTIGICVLDKNTTARHTYTL